MSDPLLDLGIGLLSFVFGAGAAYATIKNSVKTARIDASSAIAMSQDALARIAVERERSTRQEGRLDLIDERILNLNEKARSLSNRTMPAVRVPRPDERRDDTDPPPMRGRASSVRRNDT